MKDTTKKKERRVTYKGKEYGEREFDTILYNDAKELYNTNINKIAEYIAYLFDTHAIIVKGE